MTLIPLRAFEKATWDCCQANEDRCYGGDMSDKLEKRQNQANSFRAYLERKLANSRGVTEAINIAVEYGGTDGAHHKDWVIDQMARALTGDEYDDLVREACNGEDGPDTYSWDCGIAP